MRKRVWIDKVSRITIASEGRHMTLHSGDDEYMLSLPPEQALSMAQILSHAVLELRQKQMALRQTVTAHPIQLVSADASGGVQQQVLLTLGLDTGSILDVAFPLQTSRDLRALLEAAERQTEGDGETRQ